jgi:hypothetical protein
MTHALSYRSTHDMRTDDDPQLVATVPITTPCVFAVHFVCPSDFVFEDGAQIEMNDVPGPFGPVRFLFRTCRSTGGEISLPFSIEAEGPNLDEPTAIQSFADLGRMFPRIFAIASNAPGHELLLQKEFVLPDIERERRILDSETATGLLRSFYESSARTWVLRAAREYEMALRCHSEAQTTVHLAYLYQASVALSQGLIRKLCQMHHCAVSELPRELDLRPDELEGHIYRQIIFKGDTDLFQLAYEANARFFRLQHPEQACLWDQKRVLLRSSRAVASLIRDVLFDLVDAPDQLTGRLKAPSYASPFSADSSHRPERVC